MKERPMTPEPQAMTFGPSVHTFRFRNPDEWDIPFTNWTILRATDADGREHLFEVPTEALSTVTPPAAGELVVAWKRADGNDLLPAGWTVVAGDAALRAEHPPTVEDAARKAEATRDEPMRSASPSPGDLVSALAYAFARTDVPGKMETGRAYAERLVPLMEESGYLSTPAARPAEPVAVMVRREDSPDGAYISTEAEPVARPAVASEPRPTGGTECEFATTEGEK